MNRRMKKSIFLWAGREKGMALVMAMVYMLIFTLMIVPLMAIVTTGFRAGKVYNDKNDVLYSADAGIEDALGKGMESVTLFGYMYDPIYFYNTIEPLIRKHPGMIKYAGFMDDRQTMYDSISDVFSAVSKPWSLVERECRLTGTRFHGPDADSGSFLSNDEIYAIWKDHLGLK